MDLMTKYAGIDDQTVAGFYDALAEDYDLMTDFDGRFIREKPYFHMLVDRYKVSTALDAGSGTGFHTLLLTQLGVKTTAVDASEEMVKHLQQHAADMRLKVKALVGSFENLPDVVTEKCDLVLCMGNSLAHVLTEQSMLVVLKNFLRLLKEDGVLLIQNLNYDRILAEREQLQSKKVTTSKTFIRSYEYRDRRILFNVQTLDRSSPKSNGRLLTVPIRPWLHQELIGLLEKAGFTGVQSYGSIALQEYQSPESKDLVVVARVSA